MARKQPAGARSGCGAGASRARPAKAAEEFSRSLHFDSRLALCDIAGSAAQARALRRAGILSAKELAALAAGLEKLRARVAAGKADFTTGEEDIHSWVENRLRELVGRAGRQAAHRPQPQRPGRARPAPLAARRDRGDARAGPRRSTARCIDLAGRHAGDSHPRAHALPAGAAGARSRTTCWPTSRCSCATPSASAARSARTAVLTTGSGALAGTSIPLDRAGDGARPRPARDHRQQPRRRLGPGLRRGVRLLRRARP